MAKTVPNSHGGIDEMYYNEGNAYLISDPELVDAEELPQTTMMLGDKTSGVAKKQYI